MNYPRNFCHRTCPVQLSKGEVDDSGVPVVQDQIEDPPLPTDPANTDNPLQPRDPRQIASTSNYYGVEATQLSEVKIWNMVRKYGPCAAFVTVAPDDVNNGSSEVP
jgi:hypothetical protein